MPNWDEDERPEPTPDLRIRVFAVIAVLLGVLLGILVLTPGLLGEILKWLGR